MTRTRRIGCVALLALAFAGGIYAKWGGTEGRSMAGAVDTDGARVRWPLGSALRYRISWHTTTAAQVVPGGAVEGRLETGGESHLEGTLLLEVARTNGQRATLLASFADLDTARFVVGRAPEDKVVPEDTARAALLGTRAVLEVDDQGRLVEMRAPKDANRMFADVMHALATELSFELAKDDAAAWTTEERTMTGLARSSYGIEKNGDGVRIERRRDAYTKVHALRSSGKSTPSVEGTTRIALGKDGSLASFESDEAVHVDARGARVFESTTHLSLTLASSAPFVFSQEDELASFETHHQGKSGDVGAADRALAGKFSRADLAGLVAGFAASGSFERGQLARAAAYVRLNPDECKALEELFAQQASEQGKGIVFDVLTSAGSAEAQGAMRRLLESASAKKDPAQYRMLVQRLALLPRPTKESIAYLGEMERRANATGDVGLARAALVSRGAALGHAMARGDEDAKREAAAMLGRARADLSSASPEERATLIKAVGNLHHPDAAGVLAEHAKDGDATVRASVATALRKSKDDRAARVLFDLMGDEDAHVSRSAIEAHLGRRLDSKELDAFASHVRASGTSSESDLALASAVVRHVDANPAAVRSILETLLQRAPQDGEDAARLRAVLDELPG